MTVTITDNDGPNPQAIVVSGQTNGTAQAFESGIAVGAAVSYASGDRFRVEAGPGFIRYLKNGVVFQTSSKAPALPLLVDTALYTTGAKPLSESVSNETKNLLRLGKPGWVIANVTGQEKDVTGYAPLRISDPMGTGLVTEIVA